MASIKDILSTSRTHRQINTNRYGVQLKVKKKLMKCELEHAPLPKTLFALCVMGGRKFQKKKLVADLLIGNKFSWSRLRGLNGEGVIVWSVVSLGRRTLNCWRCPVKRDRGLKHTFNQEDESSLPPNWTTAKKNPSNVFGGQMNIGPFPVKRNRPIAVVQQPEELHKNVCN